MMKGFSGDFRRKPSQNLGGNSRTIPREELIRQAAEARKQRELFKLREDSAVRIQALIRGYITKRRLSKELRSLFDADKNRIDANFDVNLLGQQLQRLILFYSKSLDSERLTWISQIMLNRREEIVNTLMRDHAWLYRIKFILHLNVDSLRGDQQSQSFVIPLRLLEVYAGQENYLKICPLIDSAKLFLSIWLFLTKKGFYAQMRRFIDAKVPEPVEESPKSKTSLGESILALIIRPLSLANPTPEFQRSVLNSILMELFAPPFSPQVKLLVIPFLAQSQLVTYQVLHSAIFADQTAAATFADKNPELALAFLYFAVKMGTSSTAKATSGDESLYLLRVLSALIPTISNFALDYSPFREDLEEYEADDDPTNEDEEMLSPEQREYRNLSDEILNMLNESSMVSLLLSLIDTFSNAGVDSDREREIFSCISAIGYSMSFSRRLAVNSYRMLYTLAFKPKFIRNLWRYVTSARADPKLLLFGSSTTLLQLICRGLPISSLDWNLIIPQLTLFCSLWSYQMQTLDEVEFYKYDKDFVTDEDKSLPTNKATMPFTLRELSDMCLILRDVCIGLIELAYSDQRPNISADYSKAMASVRTIRGATTPEFRIERETIVRWQKLFRAATSLVRALHARDARRKFCLDGQWISRTTHIAVDGSYNISTGLRQRRRYDIFRGLRHLNREQLELEGPPPTATEVRNVTILQEVPFVVPFQDRVKLLENMIKRDKNDNRSERANFGVPGSAIHVNIRRNFLYEDSYEKLSPENEPNIKLPIRVNFINAVGLDEAGIDGGGVFREFLSELLKTAFNPDLGLFIYTHDKHLYPNPGVAAIYPDSYGKHYEFVGRMLGKAIYENMLIEVPFAPFFLAKLLSKTSSSDIDLHHLASLDPLYYKNLLYIKTFDRDVRELGLDFTIVNNDMGANQVVLLKPDGNNISVTNDNRIEYIQRVADYKLNRQIRAQCSAFKTGLASVIDLEYIRMFDPNELQILISGAPTPIDLEDLRRHTSYGGGYHDQHPVIVKFWRVAETLHDEHKSALLRFVTSCSRPPLLGFRNLHPSFAIQNAGTDPDRIPTASTCMNLLKLPEIDDEDRLRKKLLCAIESGAGFELS